MFEHRRQPLLPRPAFVRRLARSALVFTVVVVASLGIGTAGYHFLAGLGWIDSLLNASMILTGMGPVSTLSSTSAKLFAAGYALFSGIVFLGGVAILVTPIFHRFLHRFHLEEDAQEQGPSRPP